jgi:hypothetical protein
VATHDLRLPRRDGDREDAAGLQRVEDPAQEQPGVGLMLQHVGTPDQVERLPELMSEEIAADIRGAIPVIAGIQLDDGLAPLAQDRGVKALARADIQYCLEWEILADIIQCLASQHVALHRDPSSPPRPV